MGRKGQGRKQNASECIHEQTEPAGFLCLIGLFPLRLSISEELVLQSNLSYRYNLSCLLFSLVYSYSNQALLFLIFLSNCNSLFFLTISINVTFREIALYFKEWYLPTTQTFSFSLSQIQLLFRVLADHLHPPDQDWIGLDLEFLQQNNCPLFCTFKFESLL